MFRKPREDKHTKEPWRSREHCTDCGVLGNWRGMLDGSLMCAVVGQVGHQYVRIHRNGPFFFLFFNVSLLLLSVLVLLCDWPERAVRFLVLYYFPLVMLRFVIGRKTYFFSAYPLSSLFYHCAVNGQKEQFV